MTPAKIDSSLSEASASVQAHLSILQSIIQRMAGNSVQCKTWCITVVSAILVIVAEKDRPNLTILAFMPAVLFLTLDTYYLGLEKAFRLSYTDFVKKLHKGTARAEDLYTIAPKGSPMKHQINAFKSFSVWGFYAMIAALIGLAHSFVLK
jgi:hypothetical protein